jgi:hypothetical protein
MKNQYLPTLYITIFLLFLSIFAYSQKPCTNYDNAMLAGKNAATAQNYKTAINQFLIAQVAAKECGKATKAPAEELEKIFGKLEQQKRAAEIEKQKAIAALELAQRNLNIETPDYFKKAVLAQHSDEQPLFAKTKDGSYDFDRILFEKIDTLDFRKLGIILLPEVITLCTNLQTLHLSSNQILDISFLEKLTNLQTLHLRSNKISDISFLEKLTNLQTLDLRYNQISDISFLEKLTDLQTLDLRYNQISDISFLEKLTNLQTLDLGSNQISDISFLIKLTKLQTLYLSYNKISDISFLGKLIKLQTLYLSYNKISDISFLEKLTNLQVLYLSSNKISGIDTKRLKEKLLNCRIYF